jgi:choline kinase
MKCLIIAAGKGSRLQEKGESKPLVPVAGVPLIERVITSALAGGANEFFVVVGFAGERVRIFLDELGRRLEISITAIENEDWEKPNGVSVLKARERLSSSFLLMMADHCFDPEIIRLLARFPLGHNEIVLAVDADLDNPLVDMDDVTRVLMNEGRIEKIGKGIPQYNCFDTGLFLCRPVLFEALEKSMREGGDASLSGGVRMLAGEGRVRACPIGELFWLDVDEPKSHRQAEEYLAGKKAF